MESRTQCSRPRARSRTQKNPRPRADFPRTGPLEAKNKHTTCKFSKKKGLYKFTARSLARSPGRRKKGHDLGPFFTNQKIVLSWTKERAFSKNCRLRSQDQGLDLRGLGKELQNEFSRKFSRPRTFSKTPGLNNSNAIQDKMKTFFA